MPGRGRQQMGVEVVLPVGPTRAGRDARQIANETMAHLSGLMGANVTVRLEIEADIPDGAPAPRLWEPVSLLLLSRSKSPATSALPCT